MKSFLVVASVSIFTTAFAYFSGAGWEHIALGGVFASLVAAMLTHAPLVDWLYPKDDKPDNAKKS